MTDPLPVLTALVTGIALGALLTGLIATLNERRNVARLHAEILSRLDVIEARAAAEARTQGPTLKARPGASRRVDPGVSREATVGGRTLIAVPDLSSLGPPRARKSLSQPPIPARADLRRRFTAILELADAGASPASIARATGQPVGRIELVLGLGRRSVKSGPHGSDDPRARRA